MLAFNVGDIFFADRFSFNLLEVVETILGADKRPLIVATVKSVVVLSLTEPIAISLNSSNDSESLAAIAKSENFSSINSSDVATIIPFTPFASAAAFPVFAKNLFTILPCSAKPISDINNRSDRFSKPVS